MDPIYIGSVFLFAGNFEPKNFAFCDGRLMGIAQNTALFSILGTTYGGNGQTTFQLPNFAGRADALGFKGMVLDGNDPVAFHKGMTEAVNMVRAGNGLSLIHI